MKPLIALVALVATAGLASPGESLAQQSMGSKGGTYARLYNPQTVETVSGQVLSVDKIAPRRRGSYGVHLVLKTADGELSVHLGPSWFIDHQSMKIAPSDAIEVIGSRVTYDGKPALIASQVKKGNETIVLRDSNGLPMWSRSAAK
jgi:hypothetical protein